MMKMTFNQAQHILDAAGVVRDFVEPGPDIPDSVAVAMFQRRAGAERHLDDVIMSVLREMVIAQAREIVARH